MLYCFFMRSPLLFLPLHIWRNHVLKTFGLALLLASGLAIAGAPARALQIAVTQVDKNTDGSMTYHFAVKTDQGETLTPGESKETSDFVTVYNFYGLVDGSAKSPEGWEFSSEEFGRTPYWNGYPLVFPVDVPGTPNLTWTATKPVAAGVQIDGFTATTRVSTMVHGEYAAQVTRVSPAIGGAAAGTPGAEALVYKQALIGWLLTPGFLADVK
jgi:hypothetical protein